MPVTSDVADTGDRAQLQMPLQCIRTTEDPSTASDHLSPVKRHHLCMLVDMCPLRLVSQLDRDAAADDRAADHMPIMGVDVPLEVDLAGRLADMPAGLAAEVPI